MILIFLSCFALITLGVLGSDKELRIRNESEFITFLKSSSLYSGTTVYLESDLDFSGIISNEFEPKSSFYGSFDGQGHTISNLIARPFATNVGLFGHSYGGSIRNIVIDSSCSFTSNFTGNDNVRIGSVVGYYDPSNDNSISNIVNMANVTFEGSTSGSNGILYLGGIVGLVSSSKYEVAVKNCVNYGTVTNSGIVSGWTSIGGINGRFNKVLTATIHVQNSLNYGTIINNDTSGNLYVGGIVGEAAGMGLENCVNVGRIISNTGYKGGIVGYVDSDTNITHCLWTSDVGCDEISGRKTSPLIVNSSLNSFNTSIVNELNEYAESNDGWNKWILNTNNIFVTFMINNGKEFSVSSQIILLSSVSDGNFVFDGWYTDSYCSELFEMSEVTEETTLYGLYGVIITASFDANEGNVVPSSKKVVVNNTYGTLPTPTREGYSFIGWFTDNNENITKDSIVSISNDHTLQAFWMPNNYTATFDLGNGTRIEKDFRVDETITYPQYVTKEGHSLDGWSPDVAIADGKMPASDVTFTAQWTPNNYNATFKNGYDESDTTTKQVKCGENIEYPTISREGYTLDKWTSDVAIVDGKMPASNVTFTAEWTPINYIVTFVLGNGTKIENTLHYNDRIIHPENVIREGYVFNGWINDTEYMPSHNITITAQWTEITASVEIVFGTKDFTKEEIEDIIRRYTNEVFTIAEFVVDEKTGETKVIIKFSDEPKAEEFIRNVDENKRSDDYIKRVKPTEYKNESIESTNFPIVSTILLIIL